MNYELRIMITKDKFCMADFEHNRNLDRQFTPKEIENAQIDTAKLSKQFQKHKPRVTGVIYKRTGCLLGLPLKRKGIELSDKTFHAI